MIAPRTAPACVRTGRRGAATVEFALVAPLLFLLILGMMEFGRVMMVQNLLDNAARNGCREGVIAGTDDNALKTAVSKSLRGLGTNQATVEIRVNDQVKNASTATTGDSISVSVSVSADKISWVPIRLFTAGKTLRGVVVMRRE